MINLFVFTFLASIICLFVFVIKAKFRKKKNILGAILGIVLSFVLIGVTPTSDAKANPTERKCANSATLANKKAEKKVKKKTAVNKKTKKNKKVKTKPATSKKKKEAKEKAEAEKIAKEKVETERKAREEQEAKDKAEAERIAREEQIAREQAEAVSQQNERTVYIAPQSGSKYHYSSNCRGLKRANSISEISISEATSQGYDLCGFEK